MQGTLIDNRYKILEKRSQDKLFTLYEALDQTEDRPVTVKILNQEAEQSSLEKLLRFRRDVQNVSKAIHPNLLKIFASGESEGRDYVVTEHVNGTQPLSEYAQQLAGIDKAVNVILQASSGLAAAHEHGIIHRAINPWSILVFQNGDGVTAKLTDFGMGLLLDLAGINEEDEVIRTFGYMSPEATGILRKPIDERSDLYSLGIIFYQLVTDRLPYKGRDTSTLIHQHIAQKPAPPTELNPSVPSVVEQIILRLMAKDPLDRYQTVVGLISDLEEYLRQRAEGQEAPDFEIARSDRAAELSFATRLIGREKEMETLERLIGQTKQDKGGLALVYGSPGVGKSRLIDELRGYIHSLGGIFVGGRCYQYESTTPFNVFSEALDAYVQKLKRVGKKEQQATLERIQKAVGELGAEVIKIVPTLVDLIGEQGELKKMEPEKERVRFMITMTNFLLSLGSDQNPFVLFLDDLQWADEGSIELIERVAEGVTSRPMVVIASYRDADVYEGHPWVNAMDKIIEKNTPLSDIVVKPFSIAGTTRIVSEILMEPEEDILRLAKELQDRTEGNAFFVLELLRSLVDQEIVYFEDNHYQYDLDKLGTAALPSNVVEVVLKRIHDISEENQKILAYSALMGREIEFERLTDLTKIPHERVVDAMEEGIKNQLLARDITGRENVVFMHDRIREALYKRVSDEERVLLHEQIANLLEEQHKDDLDPVLFELAHHFAEAKMEDKTLLYSRQAAEKAERAVAYDQAVRLYEVCRGILEKQGKTGTTEYVDILESLGTVYYQAGKYDEALQTLRECETLIPKGEKLRKAGVLSKTGDTLQKKGELEECERILEQALRVLGVRLPNNIVTVLISSLRQFIVHGLHSVLPVLFVKKKYSGDPKAEVVAHLLFRLFYLYYFTDFIKGVYVLFRAQNIAEKKLGPSRKLCQIYALTGMAWMQVGWAWWARRHSRLAEKIAEDLNDKAYIGLANAFHAWVEHPYNSPESVRLGNKAVELLKGAGEYWDLGHAGCCYLWGKQKLGKNLNELIQENRGQIDIMQSINAPQNLGWALGVEGLFLTFIGDHRFERETIERLEESIRLLEQVNDKPWVICAVGYLAYAHLRLGNFEEAIRHADRVARRFIVDHNLTTWLLDIVGMCAHVYLYTVMNKPDLRKAEKKKYLGKAKYFCWLARFKGWQYPTYRGWAYQVKGTYKWVKGKKTKGIKAWDKGIEYLREQSRDIYRLACTLVEEASFLLKDDPRDKKAQECLAEAKELFTQLGAKLDLERTNELIKLASPEKAAEVDTREALTMKRQLDSLLNVTKAIGSIFVLEQLLEKIVHQAMQVTGAERGFLLLYDREDGTLRQKVSRGIQEELEGASLSFEKSLISLELVQEVELSGEGVIEGEDGTTFPKIASELKEYEVKEALSVPLKAKDQRLGMIYLDNCMAGGIFGEAELELMKSFAVQASVSIENAYLVESMVEQERLQQEMEIAQKIQTSLLPIQPNVPGYQIAAVMEPADEVGGDYYDVINIGDINWVVIGDVSGHGLPAGLIMMMVQTAVDVTLRHDPDTRPSAVLTAVNRTIAKNIRQLGESKYMTITIMAVHEDGRFTFSGLHQDIMIYRAATREVELVETRGMWIGLRDDIGEMLDNDELSLNSGDVLLLYSDGITEATKKGAKPAEGRPKRDMFGEKKLHETFHQLGDDEPAEIEKGILRELADYEFEDDVTLIVLKRL